VAGDSALPDVLIHHVLISLQGCNLSPFCAVTCIFALSLK
jgi:hypothetical protein